MQLKKILWPTDLSQSSTASLDQVAFFSRELGAEVHLLYVADDVRRFDHYYGDAKPEMLADLQERELRAAEQMLDHVCEKRLQGCPLFVRHILKGRPAAQIVALSEQIGADLIVMSNRGMGQDREDQGLFGSVTNQVVQSSSVPVLVVRP